MSNLQILTEDVLTLKEAAAQLPRRPHVATVWRWARRGLSGVKLETCKAGRDILTSRQALNRFLEAVNAESES